MQKVKVSYNGQTNLETWHIVSVNKTEPHLTLKRRNMGMSVIFESLRERERFNEGKTMCRGKIMVMDKVDEVYITAVF